jgi:hypothetical protein
MADIIQFSGNTFGEVPVDKVLEGAKHLQTVIILGWDAQGNEYFASSSGNEKENAWLAGRYIKLLLEGADGVEIY